MLDRDLIHLARRRGVLYAKSGSPGTRTVGPIPSEDPAPAVFDQQIGTQRANAGPAAEAAKASRK